VRKPSKTQNPVILSAATKERSRRIRSLSVGFSGNTDPSTPLRSAQDDKYRVKNPLSNQAGLV
jgi:hypothetical protein